MLNPALFPEQQIFKQLLKQIKSVNQAISYVRRDNPELRTTLVGYVNELKQIADDNPFIRDEYNKLYEKIINGEVLEIKDKVDFERVVGMLNPIATSFTRTLKRDAIEHRVTRETITLEVQFTPEEMEVYRSFLETNLQRYKII